MVSSCFFFGSNKPLQVTAAVLLLTVLLLAVEAREVSVAGDEEANAMKAMHESWMAEYGRSYGDEAEKARRFEVFKANVEYIDKTNNAKKKYRLGINQFTDMTSDEFLAMYTGFTPGGAKTKVSSSGFRYENFTLSDDQQEVDWRKKGAVTDIKNQDRCGCCWAFSTVAAIEGLNQMKTGKLMSLSEQQLVDCDTKDGNKGCNGGRMDRAFRYIVQSGGIASESSYPYRGVQGSCQVKQPAVKISGYESVPPQDEMALAAAVANQPVSVAVDANRNFQHYRSGVMTADACGTKLNHAVTAIGYGTDAQNAGMQYWLLKNQWGKSWGEGGYMRLQRGAGACGVAMDAFYPTMA